MAHEKPHDPSKQPPQPQPHDPSQPHDPAEPQPQPQPGRGPKAKTQTEAQANTTEKPTFIGAPLSPLPDIEPQEPGASPLWLQNTLVTDQNREDFVFLQENHGAYNGLNWHAVCLKCGWQTYQFKKEDALSYLINYHLVIHIHQGDRPRTVMIGPTAETQAPSGVAHGPQYGQPSAGGDQPQTAQRKTA